MMKYLDSCDTLLANFLSIDSEESALPFCEAELIMKRCNPLNMTEKQRRNGTLLASGTQTQSLLKNAGFEWHFDYAWELGLGRHYLG
ncbi:rpoE leader peptide RseD [Klebsiella sp. Ap-873]|uniref:Uncharacterized protein n=1 Tax=Cedecea neteri TaxID=158822 RepID=A0AAN0VRU3_9ENTR|nr:hypothetical protein LH23_00245 [Cedecea neteri]NIG81583.1 rpoE leader peptide RseD [Klebsiella sp. Ap-873]